MALFNEFMDSFVIYLSKFLDPSHMLRNKRKKEVDIAVVGLDGVFSKPFFSDQVVEKKFFCLKKFLGKRFAVDDRVPPMRKEKRPVQ